MELGRDYGLAIAMTPRSMQAFVLIVFDAATPRTRTVPSTTPRGA